MKPTIYLRYTLAAALSMLLAWVGTSCSKDVKEDNPFINLDTNELFATKKGYAVNGEPLQLEVSSNVFWQLIQDENDNWIEPDLKGGSGDETINFTVEVNKGSARQATLVFETNTSLRREVTIRQEGSEKSIEYIKLDFGSGSSQVSVNSFDQWSPEGVGVLRATYWGSNTYLDKENPSAGYDDASAGNNILFGNPEVEGAIFQINTIGIKQDMNFAIYFASMTTQSAFSRDELKLYISKDERNWTPVEYSRNATPGWQLTRVPFFIKGGLDNLYIRLVCSVENAYRIDDLLLAEGAGDGENITFIEDVEVINESLIFEDDFEWVTGKEGGNRENLGGDDNGNVTGVLDDAPHAWTLDPSNCYRRAGMIKVGVTRKGGGIVSPKLEKVGAGTKTLKIKFDAAIAYASDYDAIQIVVKNAGKINGESSLTFNLEENQVWKTAEYTITEATAETQIQVRSGIADTEQENNNRSNRFVIDNMQIYRLDKVTEGGAAIITSYPKSLTFGKTDSARKLELDSNKEWSIESDPWITVTPVSGSAGITELSVSAANNDSGDVRTGAIKVLVKEEVRHSIEITQTMVEPVTQVEAPQNLTLLNATTTNVAIGWDELTSENERKFRVEIAASADGAALQSFTPTFATAKYYLNRFTFSMLTPNTNYFVRVKTVSTIAGLDDSDFVTIPVKTEATPAHGPEVIYYHNFDGCDWGGEHVLQTWGYRPASVGGSTSPSADLTDLRDPNGGGSGSLQYMTGDLSVSRKITDWTGISTIYEYPGYIKFGSSTVKGTFSLPLTGKLTGLSNLEAKFKLAAWTERNGTPPYTATGEPFDFEVSIASGSGTIEGTNVFTVTDLLEWKEFTVTIKGADATTVLKFGPTGPGNKCRCCFDDLIIRTVAGANSISVDKSAVSLGATANLSDVVQVTASAAWTASSNASWLTVSPDSGAGGSAENVTLSATANSEYSERPAVVSFYIGGELLATVNVTQEALPAAQKIEAPQNLTLLRATTTNVALGWDELTGANARNFQVEIAATPGGEALQSFNIVFATAKYYLNRFTLAKLTPGTTYFARVKTIATVAGYADSDYVEIPVTTSTAPTYGSDVIYAHNFDGCMWGGDHVLQTWGFRPSSMSGSKDPNSAMDERKTPNDGGSNNIGAMTGTLQSSRRFTGWTSTGVYEFPGYIKLGTGSGTGLGTISIPALGTLNSSMSTTATDIEVHFKLAAWTERSGTAPYVQTADQSDFKVSVKSGAGTIAGNNVFRASDSLDWVDFALTINGADATTILQFDVVKPTGSTTSWYRCCFDDLVIKYKQP